MLRLLAAADALDEHAGGLAAKFADSVRLSPIGLDPSLFGAWDAVAASL